MKTSALGKAAVASAMLPTCSSTERHHSAAQPRKVSCCVLPLASPRPGSPPTAARASADLRDGNLLVPEEQFLKPAM